MATFRIYNIQLLPLDSATTHEVGVAGYKKLFDLLGGKTVDAKRARTLISLASLLPHDTYFAPDHIRSNKKYAFGSWVKFHKAATVTELETREPLYKAPEGKTAISNSHSFIFVFDFEFHRLAISEGGGKLPSSLSAAKAIRSILEPIATEYFPKHTLTITVVTEEKALNDALADVEAFKKVEIDITFPNGRAMSKQLKELRANNVHSLKASASSAKGSQMPTLPDWMMSLLKSTREYGSAYFSYISKRLQKRQKFDSDMNPEKFRLDQRKVEPENVYFDRVHERLRFTSKR